MELDKSLDKNKKMEKLVIYLSVFVFIILIIILITIKINIPSFNLKTFVLLIIGMIIFFGGIIGFSYFFSKRNKIEDKDENDIKLPKAITYEQARELAKKATMNPEYAEYINGCLGEKVEQLGRGVKSNIYSYKAQGYYRGDIIYVLLNMHYPNEKRSILINPTEFELERAKMSLAINPEPNPSIREIKTSNPLLGTEQITTEVIREKEEKEKEKEKNDL